VASIRVDVFVVLDTGEFDDLSAKRCEDDLRDIAYDVQLEHGVVVSLHAKTRALRGAPGPPLREKVLAEGRSYG
jgi:hypothetical protein